MKKKMLRWIIPVVLLFIIVLTVLPPSLGRLPKGHSLSEKTRLEIDGAQLGLILLSDNTDNPVLLFCGGGPGIPQYLMESLYPSVLPEYFTVCYFDYRGTGLSFDSGAEPDAMTTERYLDDVLRVTDYLKDRFGQDKIYFLGYFDTTHIGAYCPKSG